MDQIKILWVDDEIEMLKPHFIFLEERGYNITPCNNGQDAIDLICDVNYEIILLDENMPGLNGLETLEVIKNKNTSLIGGVERSGDVLIGKDIGLLVGNDKIDVKIGNDSDNLFKTADVIIDFTTAAASLLHVELAAKHNTSLILGTTGFEESQIQKIKTSNRI